MTRSAFTLNVLLTSLVLSGVAQAAGYQLKVAIPNLPPAVWPGCTTPWGDALTHNGKVFAYSAESVPFGVSCDTVKQERTCNKGTLTGTFAEPTCAVLAACPVGGTQAYATPGTYTFQLPVGCGMATVTAKVWGARGEMDYSGAGGYADATTTLVTGETLTVYVGAQPVTPGGGFGGGAASAVTKAATLLAVGGGGGGFGEYVTSADVITYGGAGGLLKAGIATGTANGGAGKGISGTYTFAGSYPGGQTGYGTGGAGVTYQHNTNGYRYHMGGGGGGYLGGPGGLNGDVLTYAGSGGSNYTLNGTMANAAGGVYRAAPGNASDPNRVSTMGDRHGGVVLLWN